MLQQLVDRAADLTRVDTATSPAQEQRRATGRADHLTPTQL
jgi:hypothetical protein